MDLNHSYGFSSIDFVGPDPVCPIQSQSCHCDSFCHNIRYRDCCLKILRPDYLYVLEEKPISDLIPLDRTDPTTYVMGRKYDKVPMATCWPSEELKGCNWAWFVDEKFAPCPGGV